MLYYRNKSLINLGLAALILIIVGLVLFIGEISQRELEARTAYEKLSAEEKLRKETEIMALKRTVNKGWEEFKRGKYENALEEADISLKLEPDNVHALRLAGMIHLSKFEFDKANNYIQKLPDEKFFDLKLKTRLLEKNDGNIPYNDVIQLFTHDYLTVPYKDLIGKSFKSADTENKKALIKNLILSKNGNLPEDKIKLSVDGKALTVKSKRFHTFPCLTNSKITDIDVSKTNLFKLNPINTLKLKKLDISYTNAGHMDLAAAKATIIDLNIEGTKFNHIPTCMSHLQFFNIAYCKFGDYSKLLRMKDLIKLTVNEGQVPKEILDQLNCDVIIK